MMKSCWALAPWVLSSCLLVLDYGDYGDAGLAVGGAGGGGGGGPVGGSGGGGGLCDPGATEECYSGPPSTRGVSICRSGTASCDARGEGFGPCEGEVTPTPERCADGVDEDCDATFCHELRWAAAFGDGGQQRALAVDAASGQVVVAGDFEGVLDFGIDPPLTRVAAGATSFLAAFSEGGAPLWAVAVDDPTRIETTSAILQGASDIFTAGAQQLPAEPWRAIVRQHEGSDGSITAGFTIDASGDAEAIDLAAVGGTVWIAAAYTGDATVSGTSLSSVAGSSDVILVQRGPGLVELTSSIPRSIGGSGRDRPRAIAAHDGNLLVAGSYEGVIDFPEPAVPALANAGTRGDMFVVSFNTSSKAVEWAKAAVEITDSGATEPAAVALLEGLVVVGTMEGEVDFGALVGPSDGVDAFVASYEVGTGALQWVRRIGGPGAQRATATVSGEGYLYVAGSFDTGADFDPEVPGDSIVAGAAHDLWLAKLDAAGTLVWLRSYAAVAGAAEPGVRLAFGFGLTLAAAYDGTLDFGGPGGLVTTQSQDVLLADFAPQ